MSSRFCTLGTRSFMYLASGSVPPIKTLRNVINCGMLSSTVTCSFDGEPLLSANFFVGLGVMGSVSAPLLNLAPAAAGDSGVIEDDASAPAAAESALDGVVVGAALGFDVAALGGDAGMKTWGAPAGEGPLPWDPVSPETVGGGAPGGAISAAAVSPVFGILANGSPDSSSYVAASPAPVASLGTEPVGADSGGGVASPGGASAAPAFLGGRRDLLGGERGHLLRAPSSGRHRT